MRRRSLCAWLLGAARPARPLAPSRPPAAAAWAPDPGDLILEAEDAAVWAEERREYAACFAADAPEAAPAGLRGVYRRSFTAQATAADGATSVRYLHAFDAAYPPLSALDAQGRRNATDDATLRPIRDLLDATCFLHERGLPHLGLNGECVRVGSDGGGGGAPRLKVVGAGAGPKLVATRRPFSLPETWAFNAPETLGAALVQSNLKALLRMDAWSVGVCCAMLLRRERASPFAAAANWRAGLFSDRDAVRARVDDVFADFSSFLTETNARSDGLLFRHGWLVEVLVGLLRRDPGDRLDVRRAARVARRAAPPAAATRPAPAPALPPPNELGRFGAAAAAPAGDARAAGEPFRSLEAMVNIAENGRCRCVVEARGEGGAWGSGVPYGEVLGFRNRADGDRWDVFLPGLARADAAAALDAGAEPRPLAVARVLGVVLIKGGNHKLAVEVDAFAIDEARVLADVRRFVDAYVATHPTSANRVRFLEYDSL